FTSSRFGAARGSMARALSGVQKEEGMHRSIHAGSIALSGLATLLLVASANATATVSPITLVSGPSPYANCTAGGPGKNYVNAEVEPYVAINPANPNNIVAAWQQDRWSNGGAHGLVA